MQRQTVVTAYLYDNQLLLLLLFVFFRQALCLFNHNKAILNRFTRVFMNNNCPLHRLRWYVVKECWLEAYYGGGGGGHWVMPLGPDIFKQIKSTLETEKKPLQTTQNSPEAT